MAIFKEISSNEISSHREFLSQLIDIIQQDISGTTTRKHYQVWVTGGVGPGVTSSLFQTVYDQDFSLQSANPILDLTVGLYFSGSTVQAIKTGEDTSGKLLFPSTSLMMREKIDIYKQFALTLLGDTDNQFAAPFGSTTSTNLINEAMFVNFKRLFFRDGIKRETFAMQFYESASHQGGGAGIGTNINRTTESGSHIYTDVGSAVNQESTFGGKVSNVVDSADTNRTVGLLFNDYGIAVFDLNKIISGTQHVSGIISAMSPAAWANANAGQTIIGSGTGGNPNARFIPDLMTSGSIDDIVDHLASTRFSSGSLSAMVFQNQTVLNSTIIQCRTESDEFNYSSNPTYIDSDNRIIVIDEGQEEIQTSFVMFTSVGLYDANNNLLAVAKLSRPVEKSVSRSPTMNVRIDF